jgi:HlyD family secretion protein
MARSQYIGNLQEADIQAKINETNAQRTQTEFQLQTEQELVARLKPLVDQGAISRITLLQRNVGVSELQSQRTQNFLKKQQLEISRVQTRAEEGKTMNEMLQDLQRQLAELDARFDTTIKDSQQQLIAVNSKLSQVQLDLKAQDLRAPTDGVVFELGPKLPGVVSQAGQTLLQVVPNEALTAQVKVANADIANVHVGMPVDVRVDAYPFTEYGSLKGVVSKVGSEAIKLSEQAPGATVFPIEVRLDRQFIERKSKRLPLTPGMSIAALVKVRQRAPITYVTEEITKAFDGLKSVR